MIKLLANATEDEHLGLLGLLNSSVACSRDADGSLVVAWAGWDHLQQATALSTLSTNYFNMKDNEGWAPERLKSLLAGIQELVPWLKQWHNEYDPEHATRMGDYFASFVIDEARSLGFIPDDLRAWKPTATGRNRGRRARSRHA